MFEHVLVIGGAGFIGSHTVDALLRRGTRVRVLDSLEPQVHGEDASRPPEYLHPEAEFLQGNLLERDTLIRALEGVDAVIHDAAVVGVSQSQYEIHRYVRANTLGTATLLDVLVNEKTSVERLMVASSNSIYGEGLYRRPSDGKLLAPTLRSNEQLARHEFEHRDPESGEVLEPVATPETKPLHCTSVYALSKKDTEELALVVGRAHGISTVACRYFNVYGPRQSLSNPYTGVAAIFSSRIKNGKPPLVYEDGLQKRDFTNVRDIVSAKLLLLESPQAEHEAFNLCAGRPTTVLEVARTLARLHGKPEIEPQVVNRYRSGDVRHCFGDASKLRALGWKSEVSLEQGLKELVDWSAEQEAEDRLDQAHRDLVDRSLVQP